MQAPEPPNGIAERPNLLATTRCSSDAQQQILARLEVKAAEKARMMDMARKSLRVAGATAGGIGIAVALLVFVKHYTAPATPVVPMVASPSLPPMPPLAPAPVGALAEPSLAALLEAGLPAPETVAADAPVPVVRIVAMKPKVTKVVTKANVAKVAKIKKSIAARKAPAKGATLLVVAKRTVKAAAPATPKAVPVDTDASLLSALLLHASRPAVVPPPLRRPVCAGVSTRPPCGPPHYNEKQAKQ